MEKLAQKWFGDIAPGAPLHRNLPKEDTQTATRRKTVEADVPVDIVFIGFHIGTRLSLDYYATDLLSDILGGGASTRFYKDLVKDKAFFTSINCFISGTDDAGLILPPRIAPIQVVIVPIFKNQEQLDEIDSAMSPIIKDLKEKGVTVKFDKRDHQRPGWKFAEYELQGVPIRLAIGARDLANGTIEMARRDLKTKELVPMDGLDQRIVDTLGAIQTQIFNKAKNFREEHTYQAETWEEFKDIIATKPGFVSAHWDGTSESELKIKAETKATIRCIPLDVIEEKGACIYSGKPSSHRVIFAKAY